MSQLLVGTRVRKRFGGRWYAGTVVRHVEGKWHHVKYDDGDSDDNSDDELTPLSLGEEVTLPRQRKAPVFYARPPPVQPLPPLEAYREGPHSPAPRQRKAEQAAEAAPQLAQPLGADLPPAPRGSACAAQRLTGKSRRARDGAGGARSTRLRPSTPSGGRPAE